MYLSHLHVWQSTIYAFVPIVVLAETKATAKQTHEILKFEN